MADPGPDPPAAALSPPTAAAASPSPAAAAASPSPAAAAASPSTAAAAASPSTAEVAAASPSAAATVVEAEAVSRATSSSLEAATSASSTAVTDPIPDTVQTNVTSDTRPEPVPERPSPEPTPPVEPPVPESVAEPIAAESVAVVDPPTVTDPKSPSAAAASPYIVPKFILTPVEVAGDDAPDTAPKPGHRNATSQTLITSAPGLRTRPDSDVTVVDDPSLAESVTVLRRYQRVLRRVFDHYAADRGGFLDQGAFWTLCKEFAVVPALIDPDDLGAVYRAVQAPALAFGDLIAALTRLALTVYRQHPRLLSAEEKLSSLFRAMQLDQKDIVLHRLRKATTTTTTTAASIAVDLEFDQKDLDREVERILASMKAAPVSDTITGTGAGVADLIGPLAVQVHATMDRVRQYTSGTGTVDGRRRPGRRSQDPMTATALGWRPANADADPFLRPIVPPGPITTLPPLYYPGLSSTNRLPAAAAALSPADSNTYRSDNSTVDSATSAAAAVITSTAPSAKIDKRRRPGPGPVKEASPVAAIAPKAKVRVGEATREKAAQVTAAEKTTERDMHQRHMGQLDRRRGRQMQRLGRHVPTQFAGKYAAVS